jgi:hypothetical protein
VKHRWVRRAKYFVGKFAVELIVSLAVSVLLGGYIYGRDEPIGWWHTEVQKNRR